MSIIFSLSAVTCPSIARTAISRMAMFGLVAIPALEDRINSPMELILKSIPLVDHSRPRHVIIVHYVTITCNNFPMARQRANTSAVALAHQTAHRVHDAIATPFMRSEWQTASPVKIIDITLVRGDTLGMAFRGFRSEAPFPCQSCRPLSQNSFHYIEWDDPSYL